MTTINPTQQTPQNLPIDGAPPISGASVAGNSGTAVPPVSGGATLVTPGTGAPALPLPTGLPKDVDVEALLKLISEESRKEMADSIVESIKTKGQRKLDVLKDQIEQIKKQIEAEDKAKSGGLLKKIFGWIGAIVSVIVSAAAVVFTAGAATPLLVGACILAGTAITSLAMQIAQEATADSDNPYVPGKLFSKMLQAFGVDEKTADIAGMAVVGGLMLVATITGAILTGGAGSSGAVSQISQMAKLVKTAAAITQSALAVVNGSLTVANAVYQYKSDMAGVDMKKIQAMLEQLRALTESEEDFLKAMMEEGQMITELVEKIVSGLNETATVVLTGGEGAGGGAAAPSMA
jgi:hypothetical protein